MADEIMEKIGKILEEAHLAKSRTKNVLTAREKNQILDKMREALLPLINAEHEAEPQEGEPEPTWFGNDKNNDVQIEGTSRDEIVQAWADEFEIPKDEVLHTQIGNVFFYTYPRLEGPNDELWVSKAEDKEAISLPLSRWPGCQKPGHLSVRNKPGNKLYNMLDTATLTVIVFFLSAGHDPLARETKQD